MKKFFAASVFILIFLVSIKPLNAQEAGISLGTSIFSSAVFEPVYYPAYLDYIPAGGSYGVISITIKEAIAHFGYRLHRNIRLNLSAGYGFGNSKKEWQTVYPATQSGGKTTINDNQDELNTEGYPVMLQLQFTAPINEAGTVNPYVGFGAGYCNYKTTLTEKSNAISAKTDFRTKGFGGFISAGISINFLERVSVFFEVQKLILSSIKTEQSNAARFPPSESAPTETSIQDHDIQPGLNDAGISAGIRLYTGKL